MKIMSIAGARPNFMKLASIADAVATFNKRHNKRCIQHSIVHTGQHYDKKMSESFFKELGIPEPNINLQVGSGTHAKQTAEIMKKFEPVLLKAQPDVLLVVGDVNSTIACALVASKITYPASSAKRRPTIVHVEAGLRSFDKDMPEEINRILTDSLSDHLFITEQSGISNLKAEGVESSRIHLVGNVMIDTLQKHLDKAKQSTIRERLDIKKPFALVTLHRPSNVDTRESLTPLVQCLIKISRLINIVFPIHPRTESNLKKYNLINGLNRNNKILLSSPLGYLDFLNLTSNASLVITDSGGIQEETTYLKIPCITLRNNTERPVTVSEGSNYLIGTDPKIILDTVENILNGHGKSSQVPQFWDGKAGERIIDILWTNNQQQ